MANIKISDLPPATTPLDNDTTLLETTVLEAGEEVSRRVTVTDLVAAISGLDASFVTVTSNAQLPNERILTEGNGISIVDNGAGNTIVISATSGGLSGLGEWRYRTETGTPPNNGQIRFDNADPTLATELYIAETNDGSVDVGAFLGLLTAGSLIYIQEKSDSANFIVVEVGTNTDSGTFATIGIANLIQQGSALSQNTRVILVINLTGAATGANVVAGTVDGQVTIWDIGNNQYEPVISSSILINPATPPTSPLGRISGGGSSTTDVRKAFIHVNIGASVGTVWSTDEEGGTPSGFYSRSAFNGSPLVHDWGLWNPGNQTGIPIFRVTSDSEFIFNLSSFYDERAAALTSVAARGQVWVRDDVPNVLMYTDDAGTDFVLNGAAGGDVFKVGTPVDNQIGVWTGDGTIEGDARLIWTGSRFELFGSGLSNRMRMEHDDTDFNMTAINGGAFIIDGLGDGIDIESNASSPAGNVYFRMHGDADNASDFNVARFVNDNAGDAGGTRIDIIGQRDTVAGLVRILHSGANHLGTPITSGPTGTVGGIGTQGAAIPFSLFTNLTERMRIEGTGEVGIRHGNVLAIYDATDADSLKWSHDGVDGLLATVGTGDLNITGLSGRIMQDAETLAFVSEITGGGVTVEDEGVPLATIADTLDFVGAGVTATGAGGTKTITIPGGGGGDVFKVGTPVDNQVGVWTGDGTIEGTTGFTYDGSALEVAGTIRVSNAAGPAMLDEAATSTNPTLVPNRADPDTGISGNGGDQLFLVAGGVQLLRGTEVPGSRQIIITPGIIDNNPALPALAFGDGDTGFYETFDDTLSISCLGAAVAEFNTNFVIKMHQDVLSNNGVGLAKIAATSTIPNILPNVQDEDSGIGWTAADALSIIAGGVEGLRLTEASSRIIQTNANHVGLTASVTQTQVGGLALLSSYNEIATVANSGDALTAFGVAEGSRLIVVNNGANDLQLFPASGDDIGAGTDASITIAAGAIGIFLGRTGAIWDTLYNAISSPTSVELPEFQFFADQLENPNNADWTVNALAPASADSNNAGLTVRLFDDTTEEGVGFTIEVPAGATNIVFDFVGRAETGPGVANTVGLDIYNRGIPDNAAVQAWSAATQLTDLDIPTNEFFQEDTQTVALATLGVTAGETTQFELVRVAPTGGTDLTGDWDLLLCKVSFT